MNQSHSNYQQCLQRNRQKVPNNEQESKEKKRAAELIKVLEAKQVKVKEGGRKELNDIESEIAKIKQSKTDTVCLWQCL